MMANVTRWLFQNRMPNALLKWVNLIILTFRPHPVVLDHPDFSRWMNYRMSITRPHNLLKFSKVWWCINADGEDEKEGGGGV